MSDLSSAYSDYEAAITPETIKAFLGAFIDGQFRTSVASNPALTYVRFAATSEQTTARHHNKVRLDVTDTDIPIELYYDIHGDLAIYDFDREEAGVVLEADPNAPVPTHSHAASAIVSGTLAHERGGLEADASAYNGLVKISGGATSAVAAPTGAVVGTSDTQTLTNKSISGEQINSGTLPAARLPNTTVSPGSYTNTDLTVGADGRITSASNGTGGGAGTPRYFQGRGHAFVIAGGSSSDNVEWASATTPDHNTGGVWVDSVGERHKFSAAENGIYSLDALVSLLGDGTYDGAYTEFYVYASTADLGDIFLFYWNIADIVATPVSYLPVRARAYLETGDYFYIAVNESGATGNLTFTFDALSVSQERAATI